MTKKKQVEKVRDCFKASFVGWLAAPVGLAFLCVLLTMFGGLIASAQPGEKNVLVVFSTFERDPKPLDLIESAVRASVPDPVSFSVEYLNYRQMGDESFRESLAETYRREFRNHRPDVIIAASIPAIQFVTQYRDTIFPGVPIVYFGVSKNELAEEGTVSGMTGVSVTPGIGQTIDLALHLNPDTNAVAVITDTPDVTANRMLAVTRSELLRRRDKVREIDIIGAPSQEMLQRISALPSHTVAIFQLAPANSTEPAIGAFDILSATAQHLPTYSPWDTLCLNYGCIGGAYRNWENDDVLAGEMAGRILTGEHPENIPAVDRSSYQIRVDWRALQRWHIPESALPPGSLVLYRQPTLWERYRRYWIVAIALVVAQVLLIVALWWQRARKRRAEAVLRESEKRFRVMAETMPSLVWMCDAEGKVTYLNERRIGFTGRNPKTGFDDTWTTYIHPDDRKNVSSTVARAMKDHEAFSQEYRLRRNDGSYRWMFDVGAPRVNGDGSFGGFIGSAIDTTDQKVAQQALEKVSGKLIEAQEKERSRIARELHDDICQRLALLSMELEQTQRNSSRSPSDTKKSLEELRKHCSEIANDVQSLSHQLHSSKLEFLGLTAAIRGFCHELSKQHDVRIEFVERNVPRYLPKDVSLCLFRVAQEALHNALKYSGVQDFAVRLTATADETRLEVSDAGAGFDVEEAKKNRGLGLVSMQERVYLQHGTILIESRLGRGTQILAVIPTGPTPGSTSEEETSERAMNMAWTA